MLVFFNISMNLNSNSHMQLVATVYRVNELTIRKDSVQSQILPLLAPLIHGQDEILGALIQDPNEYRETVAIR